MPVGTRSSPAEEGETNWAEAAAASVGPPGAAFDRFTPREYDEDNEDDDEEWVNDDAVDDHGDEAEEAAAVASGRGTEKNLRLPWILKVAIPGSRMAHGSDGDNETEESLASIYIDAGMNADRLGRCIVQAASVSVGPSQTAASRERKRSFLGYSEDEGDDGRGRTLVGLFGRHDGVFYSLECILALNPMDGERRTFCVEKPVPPAPVVPAAEKEWNALFLSSLATTERTIGLGVAGLVLSVFVVPKILRYFTNCRRFVGRRVEDVTLLVSSALFWIPSDLPSMWRMISDVLDWPAREIYRYGPPAVGWEGRDLIDVCVQMNRRYYFAGLGTTGSEYEEREHWVRNPEACESIYRMKEESFVRMCRPVWYIAVAVVGFLVLQKLVAAAFAEDPSARLDRTDRALLETYRAVQVLLREHQRHEERRRQPER